MPPSALDRLTQLNIQYPMLFKLTNQNAGKTTHCGVLEFVADEGRVYLPYWMMRNMLLEEGAIIQLESISLPVATFAKFQPQSTDFLDITNPKAVLEQALRHFACLTQGDTIGIFYNDKLYELCVLETKPGSAVTIIECDMNVEFAAPVGYQDPAEKRVEEEEQEVATFDEIDTDDSFRAFGCKGNRLDGKSKNTDAVAAARDPNQRKRGIPNYNYKKGTITFIRTQKVKAGSEIAEETEPSVTAFYGAGFNLREPKSRTTAKVS